jgi:TolB protein
MGNEGMMKWWILQSLLFALIVVTLFTTSALSQIRIDVPEPGSSGLPIALSPLQPINGEEGRRLGEEFADIISRDLDLSGLFRPIDRSAYLEGPGETSLEEINFQNWSTIGALALSKGGLFLDGDNLTVEVRLFDVAQRKQLGGKRYRGERKDLRRMAHRFADQIMLFLTGEVGPFSSKIAFVSTRSGRAKELFVTDLTGTDVVQVTKDYRINLGPSWNPTGTALTYASYKQAGPYPYRLDLLSGQAFRLYSMVGYSSRWSPDGSAIAVSMEQQGSTDLYLLSPDGGLVQRLTEDPDIDISPTWSPDSRQIAFCSDRSGGPQIYIINIQSGNVRRLTFKGEYNTSPAWSPKGDRIAYTSRSGGFHVMTVSVNGGDPQEVAW